MLNVVKKDVRVIVKSASLNKGGLEPMEKVKLLLGISALLLILYYMSIEDIAYMRLL